MAAASRRGILSRSCGKPTPDKMTRWQDESRHPATWSSGHLRLRSSLRWVIGRRIVLILPFTEPLARVVGAGVLARPGTLPFSNILTTCPGLAHLALGARGHFARHVGIVIHPPALLIVHRDMDRPSRRTDRRGLIAAHCFSARARQNAAHLCCILLARLDRHESFAFVDHRLV